MPERFAIVCDVDGVLRLERSAFRLDDVFRRAAGIPPRRLP